MTFRCGRGGYGQWGLGVSYTPAREGGWAAVAAELSIALGPWLLRVYW